MKILYAKIVDVGQGRQLTDLCLVIFTQKLYCHRSFNMWCLPPIFASQKFRTKQRYYLCIQKPLYPNLFQLSTIPTQGLSKIPQVSCHRCKKAIKIASKSVRSFIVRENRALYELVMVKNKSGRLHNEGCHHKGQYNVMFSCTKGLSIQTNKRMATSASLCEGPIFYFHVFTFMQRVKVFLLFLFIFLLWQASCGDERFRHICQVEYRQHELLLLTSPLR